MSDAPGARDTKVARSKKQRLSDFSASRASLIVLAVVTTALSLSASFLMKRMCLPGHYKANYQYTRNCYSDVYFLYGRNDKPFTEPGKELPFSKHGLAYRDNNSEYPALTGLFISAVNAPVKIDDGGGFLAANALGLSVFAFAGVIALAAVAREPKRLAYYIAAPALVSYAFHNWDLIPVGFMALAMWAYTREKDGLAGFFIGLGFASKVFPGLALPALVLARVKQRKRVQPLILWSFVGVAIPNAIVLAYAGFDGWWFPWKFQSERLPNFETVWYFILHHGQSWFHSLGNDFWFGGGGVSPFARAAQMTSLLLFVLGSVFVLWREWKRDEFRPFVAGFGCVVLFLITAKVFSPQYALWLLPFFVLVRVPWHAYLAFVLGDMLVLAAIWTYFAMFSDHTTGDWNFMFLEATVYFRYATLFYVLWWTRRGEDLAGEVKVEERPAAALWEPSAGPAPT